MLKGTPREVPSWPETKKAWCVCSTGKQMLKGTPQEVTSWAENLGRSVNIPFAGSIFDKSTKGSTIPACPSLMCFLNRGNT